MVHRVGAQCSICSHKDRVLIERCVSRGVSFRSAAQKYGAGACSVRRHMISHVSDEARAEYQIGAEAVEKLEESVAESADSVLVYYGHIRGKLLNRFDAAAQTGDSVVMDRMAKRLHENLYQTARVSGEIAS